MRREIEYREREGRWRRDDLEQRALDSARHLWTRHVEFNHRQVQEKADQLQNVSSIAALIAGFGLVSLLQFDFDPAEYPRTLMILFGLTTALTVACASMAMVMASLMHASVLRIGKSFVSFDDEAEFFSRCRAFYNGYKVGDRPPCPRRSFANHWAQRFEPDWKRAFLLYTASVPSFLANLMVAGETAGCLSQFSGGCILEIARAPRGHKLTLLLSRLD